MHAPDGRFIVSAKHYLIPVPAENSEGGEKSRVWGFTAAISPACLTSRVPSFRLLPADSGLARVARGRLQHEVYSGIVAPASTIVQIERLAFSALMVEIRTTAIV